MCETLEAWLEAHPAVPARQHGDRQQFSAYLSKDEARLLSEVAQDHRLRAIHGGKAYEVVRHALYHYLPNLLEVMDNGYRPIAELLRADIEKAGIGQSIDQINDYFETRGRELRMLVEIGEIDKALEHYEHVVRFCTGRRGVWASLLLRLLREHSEIMAFREMIRRADVTAEAHMRSIDEEAEI